MIKAPYNFVPLSDKVFFPPWAEQVSHDIPFKDGESGEIEIIITAKSPIFIRNHYVPKDNHEEGKDYYIQNKKKISTGFCSHEGVYYIPGSSVKGMVRNILEIMSFGKISIDAKKHSKKMGVRDMINNKLVGKATGKTTHKNFGYGVLIKDKNGKYTLDDYGNKIRLILQSDLTHIGYSTSLGKNKKVSDKYNTQNGGIAPFTQMRVSEDPNNNPGGNNHFDKYVVKSEPDNKGEAGKLFFNGDFPYGRTSKHYEFVLLRSDKDANADNNYTLNDEVIEGFKNVYFEDKESDVGQYWKEKDKIPIFYAVNNKTITDLGLTQVYKRAYTKSVLEASRQCIYMDKLDLAETIFGTKKEGMALKGRVQFSHLKSNATKEKAELEMQQEVLGSPQPTYYPSYIRQKNIDTHNNKKVKAYSTLMDDKSEISGWKRYPLQEGRQSYRPLPKKGDGSTNEEMISKFKPLDAKTTFTGKIRFHNLKKAEIGALLSALTFHGKSQEHMHNMGMAKPLGYGKIDIQLKFNDLEFKQDDYLSAFQEEMHKEENWDDEEVPFCNWLKSPQIEELLAMSNIICKSKEELRYQLLNNPKPKYYKNNGNAQGNDFVGAKDSKEYLMKYSAYSNIQNEVPVPKKRKKLTKTTQVIKLAKELQIATEEILNFANEENIDIKDAYSFIPQDTVDIIKEYLGNA